MEEGATRQGNGVGAEHGRMEPEVGEPGDSPVPKPATKPQPEKITDEMSPFEHSTIRIAKNGLRWTGATFVIFLITLVVAVLQYRAMDGQLQEMRAGGQDTHDLAVQAKNQADRTKELAERLKEQTDQTKTMATQAIIQAQSSQSSVRQNEIGLKQYRDANRNEQRAYIVMDTIGLEQVSDSGPAKMLTEWAWQNPIRARIIFRNIGKSPAMGQHGVATVAYVNTQTRDDLIQVGDIVFKRTTLAVPASKPFPSDVGPGQAFIQLSNTLALKKEMIDTMTRTDTALAVSGIVQYQDIFGDPHETQFCMIYWDNPGEFRYCGSHNTIR